MNCTTCKKYPARTCILCGWKMQEKAYTKGQSDLLDELEGFWGACFPDLNLRRWIRDKRKAALKPVSRRRLK